MRTRFRFCIAVAAAASLIAEAGRGVTLDRKGKKVTLPCDGVKLTKAKFVDGDPNHAYVFEGTCFGIEGNKPVFVNVKVLASWNNATKMASENVTVTGSASGKIYAKLDCPKDPWVNNVVCSFDTGGYSNTTGSTLLTYSIPLTRGRTNASEAKSKSSSSSSSEPPEPPAPVKTKTPKIKLQLPTRTPTFIIKLPPKQSAPVIVSPQNAKVYTGSVLVKIQPGPGSSATKFNLQWELQNSQTAQWEPKSVVAQFDSAANPNGLNVPYASFGKAGMWRLKAKAGALGFWSGYTAFGVQP